jgi:hypothetical protein
MFVVMIVALVAVAVLQPIVAAWAIARNPSKSGPSALRKAARSGNAGCRRK